MDARPMLLLLLHDCLFSGKAAIVKLMAATCTEACSCLCRPSCFRFPRGSGMGVDLASEGITPDLKGTPLPVSVYSKSG